MILVDKKFKDMSPKQKLSYIWDYYKVPIIITIVVILVAANFIHERLTAKTTIFRLAMIDSNVSELIEGNLIDGFYYTCPGFDPEREQMILDANYDLDDPGFGAYTTRTKLTAEYTAGTIDATIAHKETALTLAESQAFADLSEAVPNDLMDEIESRGLELLFNKYEDPATGQVYEYPFAVNVSGCPAIQQGFTESTGDTLPYYDEDCYFALCPNSPNIETGVNS